MSDRRVVIIGAGLAGLTAARRLGELGVDCLLLEAGRRPGGLCRSEENGGFLFDYTGHLLHLRPGRSRDLIIGLLGDRLAEHRRRASIFVDGRFIPYPIQAHFGQLSPRLAAGCLEGFKTAQSRPMPEDPDFETWSKLQFGDALAELFMLPYNRKLYVHPLSEMEVSWTSWSVPRPTLEEVEQAAAGVAPAFGYNATFFYPTEGGIQILPDRLADGLGHRLHLDSRVSAVDTAALRVTTDDGATFPYDTLISTIPLPELLAMTLPKPGIGSAAAGRLRCSAVLGICLGFDQPSLRDDHWVYVPEERYPFYRVGLPTSFSGRVAPAGCSSIYSEVACLPGRWPDPDRTAAVVEESVKEMGIIPHDARSVARIDMPMPAAYVFFDRFRRLHLPAILEDLRSAGILSVGRYGAWEYSAMQDAVEWGLRAAGLAAGEEQP